MIPKANTFDGAFFGAKEPPGAALLHSWHINAFIDVLKHEAWGFVGEREETLFAYGRLAEGANTTLINK